ncbi:hypothetical protein [Niallia sp. 03190]|uniref:hypothetical protein n=1 Tax=Niallia sp. 03190 TaxID=3458061 RepID=UPI004043A544
MEYSKQIKLYFPECYSLIEMDYAHEDSIILTINELGEDEENSSSDNKILKTINTVEIVIGEEEARELIRSLQSLLPREEC